MEDSTVPPRSESLESRLQVYSTGQEQKKYKCLICSKSFKTKYNLNDHVFTHTNERPFKCTTCGNAFKTLQTFKKHETIHSGEKPFNCPTCTSKFSTKNGLKSHTQLVHENDTSKSWKCRKCHKSFSCAMYLSKHIKTHSDLKPFDCIFCKHPFRTLASVMFHIGNRHLQEKPFLCDQCPAGFAQLKILNRHVNRVHKKGDCKEYRCFVCQKFFRSRQALCNHMTTHTGEKPFKCSVCDKSFSRKSHLNGHAGTHDSMLRSSCKICNKTVATLSGLKRHEKRHTATRAFKCGDCSAAFFELSDLKTHVKQVHIKERPFPCNMCAQSFFRTQHRDQHMVVHLNEKPYQCGICGKRNKHGITYHMTRHNTLTDFHFPRCPKRCCRHAELSAHYLKVHVSSKESLLSCLYCDQIFQSIWHLESHTHKHTKERHYFCNQCDDSYSSKNVLDKHKLRVHENM